MSKVDRATRVRRFKQRVANDNATVAALEAEIDAILELPVALREAAAARLAARLTDPYLAVHEAHTSGHLRAALEGLR